MLIAVCDDNINELETTSKFVNDYFTKENISVDILKFNHPAELLDHIRYNPEQIIDVFFLDIVMQINGIDVAKLIRKNNDDSIIIFTTTSKEFAIDAFAVRAYDYILKPIDQKDLNNKMSKLVEKLSHQIKSTFTFKTSDLKILNIEIKNIAYIESIDRRMQIHMINKEIYSSTVLKNKFLDSIPFDYESYNFINCHVSYIVNMNHIKAIDGTDFILKNDSFIPISKKAFTKVKKQYIDYLLGE